MDDLLQFVIPLIVAVVWIIGQFARREPPKPPQRPKRLEGWPTPPEAQRPGAPRPAPRPIPRQRPAFDEIVILDDDPRAPGRTRPGPASRSGQPAGAPPAGGASRSRPASTSPKTRDNRSGKTAPAGSQPGGARPSPESMGVTSGGLPSQFSTSTDSKSGMGGEAWGILAATAASRSTVKVEQVRSILFNPQRVREAIILREILGPPVALRRGRRPPLGRAELP